MNKEFFKYIFKFIAIILIVWAIFIGMARNFGMFIYDEEYASYKQTLDYINNATNDYNNVLIFGDSVAKAAVIPNLISDETYNISMAGATTIEQYYMLQDYLKNHEPPKNLIVMYFIGAYDSIDDFFWNRTIYFNCLTTPQFFEIAKNNGFGDSSNTRACTSEFFQYKLCMPNKYLAPIKLSIFENNRYEINKNEYEIAQKNKGQHYFGTAEFYESDNVTITGKQHFEVLPIIDLYMNKCIELCKENNIQVIIEQHPINESTYANMKIEYKQEYIDYMKSLKDKYPEIIVNTEYNVCPNNWLGDFSHLNENGATKFTESLKQKYADYLN